jgi:hypothetical protein
MLSIPALHQNPPPVLAKMGNGQSPEPATLSTAAGGEHRQASTFMLRGPRGMHAALLPITAILYCLSVTHPFVFTAPPAGLFLLHARTEATAAAARTLSAAELLLRPRCARLAEAFLLGVPAANRLWPYHVHGAPHVAHRCSPMNSCAQHLSRLQLRGGAAARSQLDAPS